VGSGYTLQPPEEKSGGFSLLSFTRPLVLKEYK